MIRSQQKGSAEVVAIGVLVLALLLALGWIFYQNFYNQDTVKKDTEAVAIDKDDSMNHESSDMLELSELGIMVPINKDSSDFMASFDGGTYTIKSNALAEKCGNGSTGTVGVVTKRDSADDGTAASSSQANAAAKATIGGADYLFVAPQQACGDPSTTEGQDANKFGSELTNEFAKLFEKAH